MVATQVTVAMSHSLSNPANIRRVIDFAVGLGKCLMFHELSKAEIYLNLSCMELTNKLATQFRLNAGVLGRPHRAKGI